MGQARELAAALLEAADELDRWADRGKTRDSPSPPDQTNNGRAAAVFFRFVVAIQQVDNYVSGMRTEEAMIPQVNARDVAQAVELVRALRDQLHQMTHELVRLERLNVNGTSSRATAIRCEAAALRRDINEAQTLIDLLELRYLNGNGHAQPRLPEQPRRSIARLQQGTRSP